MNKPNFKIPKLLTAYVPIDVPLPKIVKKATWWKKQREASQEKNNDCCWSCGIDKKYARWKKWLEGHESYDLDYENKVATLTEVVSMCHLCHRFSHGEQTAKLVNWGMISPRSLVTIWEHGFKILKRANLPVPKKSAWIWLNDTGYSQQAATIIIRKRETVIQPVIYNINPETPWSLQIGKEVFHHDKRNQHPGYYGVEIYRG
jgi:hypothetical protein